MKNIIMTILLVFALNLNTNAQEIKPKAKKEVASSKKKAISKTKASCETDANDKTVSNEKKSCKSDGSCCGGAKASTKS